MPQRHKVLLIDDPTTGNVAFLSAILSDMCEVIITPNGHDGIARAARELPDLIILDVVLPGVDGHTVCRALKSDPRTADIPVIFITELNGKADEAHSLEMGAIDYVTKPISTQVVRARVRNHLKMKGQHENLQRLSAIDGLTGVANRARFDQQLQTEWKLSLRNAEPLGLLLIDVDFFDPFNDKLGHAAGNECLKKITHTLAAPLRRPADLLARYGNGSFSCLLPTTDLAGALAVAEQLCSAVNTLNIAHPASPIGDRVTISVGVAALLAVVGEDASLLRLEAEHGLAEAIGQGRNRAASR